MQNAIVLCYDSDTVNLFEELFMSAAVPQQLQVLNLPASLLKLQQKAQTSYLPVFDFFSYAVCLQPIC